MARKTKKTGANVEVGTSVVKPPHRDYPENRREAQPMPEMEHVLDEHDYETGLFVPDPRLPEKCRRFLEMYCDPAGTWTISGTMKVMGFHPSLHSYWRKTVDGYEQEFERAKQEAKHLWYGHYAEKARGGLKEVVYDAEGNVKHTRIREDAQMIKSHMAAIDPDRFGNRDRGGGGVTIQIVQSQEWTVGSDE